MIPKIIHYCWFGRGEKPELAKKCIASWKKFCPDFEIREWNEDNCDYLAMPFMAEAYAAKKYAFVSDVMRLAVLEQYGGVYFDTDVEVLRENAVRLRGVERVIADRQALLAAFPDLKTKSQQRNVVLHPEFVNGKYALYTRPQDGFIDAGSGGGIGWALVDDITHAEVKEEKIIDCRYYHTIKEVKNGEGPHPIKTPKGWLHLAHGVRGCAAGLRYVLYMYMTSLEDPSKLIAAPGGYFMTPEGEERIGDVSNVLFTNGWIADEDGKVFIYYASSDTRMHVAVSTIDKLVDYCMNTPQDGLTTTASVETLKKLIDKNLKLIK